MRAFAWCILALGLTVSPVMAGTGTAGDKDSSANTSAEAATKPADSPKAAPKADSPAATAPSSMEIETELQQMRDLLESQSKQIQDQQQKMELLEEQLNATNASRESLVASPAATSSSSAAPEAIGPAPNLTAGGAAGAGAAQGTNPEPAALMYKGISLTPVGFMAAESVWRQKALSADVNTPFSSTPFNGSSAAHLSEFNASGRQSRIGMLVQGKISDATIGGYYEMDFLSAGTTSTPTQSNSYTMRQRQFWGQAALTNGWTFTGGQMWSLLTETTSAMNNRTEALPQTIDSQYHVGFSWARQYGFRVTKSLDNNKLFLGAAVEQAAATVTVHGNPTAVSGGTAVCITTACTGTGVTTINTVTTNNFLLGAFGTSGGLYNPLGNYAYNPSPDFIVKAVFEPMPGQHYEVFGILSDFRDRAFPCVPQTGTTAPAGCGGLVTSPAMAFNDNRVGGGVGANARWNLLQKKVDVGIHFMGGSGIGRYGSTNLADATIRPNGTMSLIHNFQALGTLQFHPTPKLDINLNAGGEFEERTYNAKTGGALEGYGYPTIANYGCWTETQPIAAPGTGNNLGTPTGVAGSTGFIPGALASCTGDTRNIIEGSIGFWYRFYKGSKGTVQYGMQYSNFVKNTWRGVGTGTINGATVTTNGTPHSDENMVFTSFRYYLP